MCRQRLQENRKILFNIQLKKSDQEYFIDFRDLIIVVGKVWVNRGSPSSLQEISNSKNWKQPKYSPLEDISTTMYVRRFKTYYY